MALIFITDNKYSADLKIYWESNKYNSDIKAYETDNKNRIKGSF